MTPRFGTTRGLCFTAFGALTVVAKDGRFVAVAVDVPGEKVVIDHVGVPDLNEQVRAERREMHRRARARRRAA